MTHPVVGESCFKGIWTLIHAENADFFPFSSAKSAFTLAPGAHRPGGSVPGSAGVCVQIKFGGNHVCKVIDLPFRPITFWVDPNGCIGFGRKHMVETFQEFRVFVQAHHLVRAHPYIHAQPFQRLR